MRATARRRPGVLAVLGVAEFMLVLDVSIVNVALPAIRADLGFAATALEWVVNSYALTFGGFMLLGGRAADLIGGRRVFLAALAVFSAASLGCGLATSQIALVLARAVQGLSAGVLSPATLSILTATYDEPRERSRALSTWTAVAIAGGAVGALLGGALTDALSWRAIFIVNVPVGAALLALATARLPRSVAGDPGGRLDVAGAVTVSGGLLCLVWALIRAGDAGWGSTGVLAGLAAAALLLGAFVLIEARIATEPLVPLSVFRSRLLSAGNALGFGSFVPVPATWFFLTLYLQSVRGYTAIQAGLVFVPMSLAVIGGAQIGFRALPRIDARPLYVAGAVLAAAGLAWLAQLSATTALAWVIVPGCITMVGGGLVFAPVTVAATAGAAPAHAGLASGLLNTTRQLGGALGLAVLGSVAAVHGTGDTGAVGAVAAATGYSTAFTLCAAVFLVTAVAGALALPARLGVGERADAALQARSSEAPSARALLRIRRHRHALRS